MKVAQIGTAKLITSTKEHTMPTRFIDIEQNITVQQYLHTLQEQFKKRGVVFERDGKNSQLLQLAITHINRLHMVEELFNSGHGETTKITCDTCESRTSCPSAYDMYNTDGDCLEDK